MARQSKRGSTATKTTLFNERDEYGIGWAGQQYAMRLDHAQWVLGQMPGGGAVHEDWISEGAARDVITRWKAKKWVYAERLGAHEPLWIWPTRRGLKKVGLPYSYRDIESLSAQDRRHLFAINEVRLHLVDGEEGAVWTSERHLLQGVMREQGKKVLHRPDGEARWEAEGEIIAVEAELSAKKPFELAEILMELLRGEEYVRLKEEHGWRMARQWSKGAQSQYTTIWYVAPEKIRGLVRRERGRLMQGGDITKEEAERLVIRWYPLAATEEEATQEEQEDQVLVQLTDEQIERDS